MVFKDSARIAFGFVTRSCNCYYFETPNWKQLFIRSKPNHIDHMTLWSKRLGLLLRIKVVLSSRLIITKIHVCA